MPDALGSCSEFFARAASRWASELEGGEITAAIDAALEAADDGPGDNDTFFRASAMRTLARLEHDQNGGSLGR